MIQILAFQANPKDKNHLRLNAEVREIQNVLLNQPFKGLFDYNLVVHPAMQASDLQTNILYQTPQIVHFSGHGDRNGILVEDSSGRATRIPNATLKTIFQNLSGSIQCVILNSCYSAEQADLISKYIPCVVGMKSVVDDESAIEFSKSFYQALIFGKSIGTAFDLAKGSVVSGKARVKDVAKLHHRKDVDPDLMFLVKPPHITAELCTDDDFEVEDDGEGNYTIALTVNNVPTNAVSVVIQYNHTTIEDQFYEAVNDGTGFYFEPTLGGNVQIRLSIWLMDIYTRTSKFNSFGSQYAFGFTTDLHTVLRETYSDESIFINKSIRAAIEDIGNN